MFEWITKISPGKLYGQLTVDDAKNRDKQGGAVEAFCIHSNAKT